MKKIVIIGDSLTQIRYLENLKLENIYQYNLQKQLKDHYVINFGSPSNSSRICATEMSINNHILGTNADTYIIQLGIVDCAPTIFNKYERKIFEFLTYFPIIGKVVQKFVNYLGSKRRVLTKIRKNVRVDIQEFELNLIKIVENINKVSNIENILFINIAYPLKTIQVEYTNIMDNINNYNKVFEKLSKAYSNVHIIDLYSFTKNNEETLLDDGMHINSIGHEYITQEVLKTLKMKDEQ